MSTLDQNKDLKNVEIYTIPNIITLVRLVLIPIAFSVVLQGHNDLLAFILFALAGSTDFLDGMIARRTNTVTELGKILDPLVDRFLIAAGVLSLFLVGRVPLWMLVLLISRDLFLVFGNSILRKRGYKPIEVLFLGKVTTAILFAGLAGLILNWPHVLSPELISSAAFPGFNGSSVTVWIYFVYLGIALSLVSAGVYLAIAIKYIRHKDAYQDRP